MRKQRVDSYLFCALILLCFYLIVCQLIIHYRMSCTLLRSIVFYHHEQEAFKKRDIWQRVCEQEEQEMVFKVVNRSVDHLQWHTTSFLKKNKIGVSSSEKNNAKPRPSAPKKRVIIRQRIIKKNKKRSSIGTHATGFFRWPLKKKEFWLSSFFGSRKKPNKSWGFHYGIDMAALKGTIVYAAASGRIIYADHQKGYGNTVLIAHNNQYTTRYAHLDTIWVRKGTEVSVGRAIGTVGDTGHTIKSGREASHLHFEISHRGKHVNPLPLLPFL